MKTYIKLSALVFISLFYLSCSDLLDIEENKDVRHKDSVVNKEESPKGFRAKIYVTDDTRKTKELVFGMDSKAKDAEGMYAPIGTLDAELGEVQLALPQASYIFDARWSIPQTNGTLVNIYPFNLNGLGFASFYYRFTVQPTQSGGMVHEYLISWDIGDIPTTDDNDKNPDHRTFTLIDGMSDGNLMSIDMRTGVGNGAASFIKFERTGEFVTVTVQSPQLVTSWAIKCE